MQIAESEQPSLFPNIDIGKKQGLYFVRQVKLAWQTNGYVDAHLEGEKSIGKTSYALWCLYSVYGSWDKALEQMYFDPDDALLKFKELNRRGVRLPLVCMDDAATHLSRSTWWAPEIVNFSKFYNVIRSVCSGCLFTAPSVKIPTSIFTDIKYRVQIRIVNTNHIKRIVKQNDEEGDRWRQRVARAQQEGVDAYKWRKAILYTTYRLPSGEVRISRTHFTDYYPHHYKPHNKYVELRRAVVDELIDGCLNPEDSKKKIGRPIPDMDKCVAYMHAYDAIKNSENISDAKIAKRLGFENRQPFMEQIYKARRHLGLHA